MAENDTTTQRPAVEPPGFLVRVQSTIAVQFKKKQEKARARPNSKPDAGEKVSSVEDKGPAETPKDVVKRGKGKEPKGTNESSTRKEDGTLGGEAEVCKDKSQPIDVPPGGDEEEGSSADTCDDDADGAVKNMVDGEKVRQKGEIENLRKDFKDSNLSVREAHRFYIMVVVLLIVLVIVMAVSIGLVCGRGGCAR